MERGGGQVKVVGQRGGDDGRGWEAKWGKGWTEQEPNVGEAAGICEYVSIWVAQQTHTCATLTNLTAPRLSNFTLPLSGRLCQTTLRNTNQGLRLSHRDVKA
jgi:hypothetical protein